ncbi:MAG: Flp pilus assembly protein CpaB [Bdellovibrionaceae bacterium]|nr:Flp pilus assembly protein CpaB [Pseudobdellovibrionaceae bacterium]MDW8189981.1 Flp pilus assembly protein CpaB [Pseudobdellovibrionaceae bacterium]
MNQDGKNFLVALIAGLVAAFLMFSYSQERKAEVERELGDRVTVVVAKKNILELQTIEDDLLDMVEIPKIFVQPGAVNKPDLIIGQVAATPIQKGEQILFNKLLQPGADTGISLQVSPTKRALTIPVDETRGVAKLIRPGDRVDIIVAIDSGKGIQAKRDVITMLSDVAVLATGSNVVNNLPRVIEYDPNSKSVMQTNLVGDTKYTSITIEVSPKEAQDLVYILSTSPGNIFFTLRNPSDKSLVPRMPSSSAEGIAFSYGGIITGSANPGASAAPGVAAPGAPGMPSTAPAVTIPPQYRGSSGR